MCYKFLIRKSLVSEALLSKYGSKYGFKIVFGSNKFIASKGGLVYWQLIFYKWYV